MRVKSIILAGGKGTRLGSLTIKRAKPAVPFGGKYRIIDFTLSNCVNSNIFDVLILTQYRPHSLNDHIGKGRPWDLDRSFTGGVRLLQPYKGSFDTDWYAGTADAVMQNMNFVRQGQPEYVLVLSGDHIYQMDYDMLLNYHRSKDADVTICTIRVPLKDAPRFGILDVDDDFRVTDWVEKPADPPGDLASMGVYVFSYAALEAAFQDPSLENLEERDFGKHIVPNMLKNAENRIFAYPYGGYWVDVGTVDAYWEAHMDLLEAPPSMNLNDRTWVIHTRSEERPPVRMENNADIKNSLITDGAVIGEGATVERSVLSPGVYVGPGAVIRDSVILNDAYIEAGAVVERCIIDKIVVVGQKAHVGAIVEGADPQITSVGKNTFIPPGYRIGPGCTLGTDLRTEDFAEYSNNKSVPAAQMIGYKSRK